MPNLYRPGLPLPFFEPGSVSTSAGYTQRLLRTTAATTQRTLQPYMPGVAFLRLNDMWLHPLSDAVVRDGNRNTKPYQAFHVYTTSLTSPDGDLPFKKGDVFIPNQSAVGLVANTAHVVEGVQALPHFWELILWRDL